MQGNSNLQYDEAFIAAIRGRIVSRQTVVTQDPRCPFFYAVLDPAAVYPAWDRHGLTSVAHVYQTTLGEAISSFGDSKGKLRRLMSDAGPDGKLATGRFDRVTVVEWWDRRWHAAKLKDGRVLLAPTEHHYAEVPFVYTIADTGRPAVLGRADAQVRTPDGETSATTVEEEKQRDVGLPLFAGQMKHIEQTEALMSKNMQLGRLVDRPPIQIEQDDVAKAGNPDPEVSFEPGAVNRTMKDNERLNPIVLQPPAGVLQPVMGELASEARRVYQPEAAYGAAGGVNTGNAMEGQVEAGRDKELPLVRTLERHYASVAALTFRQLLRRGREIGAEGSLGEFRVPYAAERRRGDGPSTFVLTPRTIKKAGPQVRARLTHVEMRNLPGMFNAMNLAKSLRLPLRPLIELAGWPNAHDLLEEGLEEELMYGADATPMHRFTMLLENMRNPDGSIDMMAAIQLWALLNPPAQGQGGGAPQVPMGGGMGGGGLPVNTSALNISPTNFPQGNVGMGAGAPVTTGAGLAIGGPQGMPRPY